jgi:hypothetical protein
MTFEDFKQSLKEEVPPGRLSVYLQSLWYDGKNEWDRAHELVQDLHDETAAWIHAYLHRKEGDFSNAGYWYNRAGKKRPEVPLTEEWENIVKALL